MGTHTIGGGKLMSYTRGDRFFRARHTSYMLIRNDNRIYRTRARNIYLQHRDYGDRAFQGGWLYCRDVLGGRYDDQLEEISLEEVPKWVFN